MLYIVRVTSNEGVDYSEFTDYSDAVAYKYRASKTWFAELYACTEMDGWDVFSEGEPHNGCHGCHGNH